MNTELVNDKLGTEPVSLGSWQFALFTIVYYATHPRFLAPGGVSNW